MAFGGTGGARPLAAQLEGPAEGKDGRSVRLSLTADAGASLQDNFGRVRVGRDMVTYGIRATAVRRAGLDPWVDLGRFTRPGLECVSGLRCARSGSLARAGVTLPLAAADDTAGLHAAVRGGVGAAFARETSLSYLIGFSLGWRQIPRLSPIAEVRWEHIAGLDFTMLAAGLRIDL